MALELNYHPLASYCWKPLIALYENGTPFTPRFLDLAKPEVRAALTSLYPMSKMPVLVDGGRGEVVPESSVIIEYLALHHPGPVALVPKDAELARKARAMDRFFDQYVHNPMQKIVVDRLRPAGQNDPFGVAEARQTMQTAYAFLEKDMAAKTWAIGDAFTMADCAACPALFYANMQVPFGSAFPNLTAYLRRLSDRPSFARVLQEAEPYFKNVPKG